jgi:hypothetical protein
MPSGLSPIGAGTEPAVARRIGGSLEPIHNIGDPLIFRIYITASPAT